MKRADMLQTGIAAALLFCCGAAGAEVRKTVYSCANQLCPWFQLVFTPPDGWMIDNDASLKNKVQVVVPKGENFATAPALFYVQVFYHADKQQSLADFARTSNERWQATHNAKISELAAVERTNGKPAFLRFSFENRGKAQQAYEVGAFGLDADRDGNEFVLDVVLTGPSKAALDRANQDYISFLKAH